VPATLALQPRRLGCLPPAPQEQLGGAGIGGVLSVRSDLHCLDLYLGFHYIHGVPDSPITERAFFVLTVLAGGPRHGYGLVDEVAELSRGRLRLTIGSLYGVLDRVAAEGLIEPDREESRDGRLRRYYRLTENGRRALALGRPPSPRCDCRGAEEPACRHRPVGAGQATPDLKARGGMSGNMERRDRQVLQPLPGWYRQQWERDMVAPGRSRRARRRAVTLLRRIQAQYAS